MKKHLFITLAIIFVGGVTGYLFSETVEIEEYVDAPKIAQDDQSSIPTEERAPASRKIAQTNPHPKAKLKRPIIERIKLAPHAARMHKQILTTFKNLESKQALADWVVLGLQPISTKEYQDIMLKSIDDLNQSPDKVLDELSESYSSFSREDAFLKSMLINVVHQLDVPPEDKVQFYGTRFADKVVIKDDHFDADSMNITNAMAFANQYIKSSSDIKDYIFKGLQRSSNDRQAQLQLAERFKAYFPEMKTEIDNEVAQ